ncbi:MAG: hypothetical protein ACOWWH_09245 [Eubacteriaceae bacterium]
MYQSEFNPVSFEIQISLIDETSIGRWAEILKYFMTIYAKSISKKEKSYIGHIKAISIIDNDNYIKLSIYRSDIPAELDKNGNSSTKTLIVSINSFVYGVDYNETITTFKEICKKMKKEFLLTITFKANNIIHHHNH